VKNGDRREQLLIRPAREQDFGAIRDFLIESSHLYPGIDLWWDSRVAPEAKSGHRVILVIDDGLSLQGLFIGKPGPSVKICTLRLREEVRRQGIGRALITEGFHSLLVPDAHTVRVTISEGAEEGCLAFFESIGFRRRAIERNRYRKGLDEFIYSSSAAELAEVLHGDLAHGLERTLFGAVPRQLPSDQTVVMSLRPQFAELVLQGLKTVEFRRKFSTRYEGATIVFYVTHPVRQFRFTATIAAVEHAQTKSLWSNYRTEGGVEQDVFEDYFSGTEHGFAIRLEDVRELPSALELDEARRLCPRFRPPQSFQKLPPESPLSRALDLPVSV